VKPVFFKENGSKFFENFGADFLKIRAYHRRGKVQLFPTRGQ